MKKIFLSLAIALFVLVGNVSAQDTCRVGADPEPCSLPPGEIMLDIGDPCSSPDPENTDFCDCPSGYICTYTGSECVCAQEQIPEIAPSDCCIDLDGDGTITITEVMMVVDYWNTEVPPAPIEVDLNCDGKVDILDIMIVSNHHGKDVSDNCPIDCCEADTDDGATDGDNNGSEEIPEFPTIAIPVIGMLAILAIMTRRR